MSVTYVFSVCFTPIIRRLWMYVCVFFQGKLVNLIIPLSSSHSILLQPKKTRASFFLLGGDNRDYYKYTATSLDHGGQCFFWWCCPSLLECCSWSTLIQVHHFVYEAAQKLPLPQCLTWPIPLQIVYLFTQSSFTVYKHHTYYIISAFIKLTYSYSRYIYYIQARY